jgi:Asparagine synthase
MYFTLAVSAATRQACAALVSAAASTDPRVMPIPGPPVAAWQADDERAAVLYWPGGPTPLASGGRPPQTSPAGGTHLPGPPLDPPARAWPGETMDPRSHAGTIWADRGMLHARTWVARVDPVYVAEAPGAVVVSDRASWAAAVTGRLTEPDPAMIGAFLSMGYPVGAATPFRGVRALGGLQTLTVTGGRLVATAARDQDARPARGAGQPGAVAAALVDEVRPLSELSAPVELSLTGGKDSRLIAAALTAADVPFKARTHGFADHPDVVVAAMVARRLGIDHVVTEPRPPGNAEKPDEAELLARLRSAVLVSDGMLSAFENVGRPDPHLTTEPVQTGGHGGELLRGGYAQAAWRDRKPPRAWSEAGGVELFRRLTTRRLGLLRPAEAGEYLASLSPYALALARGPLRALDDFYLANRAGRWSAAARQGYLLRWLLVQPFFGDGVIRAARAVPLPDRITDRLHREVLAALCPDLLDLPLAGSGWKSGPRTPLSAPAAGPGSAAAPDWRRAYGDDMARLLRDCTLDLGGTSRMFDILRRQAVERVLRPPQGDPHAVWALATLAVFLSGDWLNARGPADPASHPEVPDLKTPKVPTQK